MTVKLMRTHLRKIGNSRGVIIPSAFLEACSLSEEVDLRIEGTILVIEALKKPRSGWFDEYQTEATDDAWENVLPDDISEEWEW